MQIGKIFKKINKKFKFHKFSELKFDSLKCKRGDVFFAIKGTRKNGNKFIKDAINNGAKTIISNLKKEGFEKGVLYLSCQNPRKLLAETASIIYKKKPKNLISITGTNGKSSVANFFIQILKQCNKTAASIGTLGVNSKDVNFPLTNTTLDPLSLNKILEKLAKKKINNVILEASSHGLKQHRLDGVKFDIGLFTNFSRDHLDYHKSFKDYFDSKMILFNKLMKKNSHVIYDSNILESKKIKTIIKRKKLKHCCLGNKKSDLKVIKHTFVGKKQKITFVFKNQTYSFDSNLIGAIQIKNLLFAVLAANQILSMKRIIRSLSEIKPVNGRFEKIGNLKNNSIVILDFAHTPQALKICLENIKNQFKFKKISLVFGCGGERDKSKREIMGMIANKLADKIYLTDDNPRGENPKKIRSQIKKKIVNSKITEIASRSKAIEKAIQDLNSENILVVAGKGHENYQEYLNKKFFSDRKCILKNIKLKNKSLSKDWKANILKENISSIKLYKINSASIDSKKISKNDIFFGIKGKNKDGNKFANEAIKKGASYSIVDKNYGSKRNNKIKVKNVLKFLSILGSNIRKVSNIHAISITGSSGKTSLKELLGKSLSSLSSTYYSKKSYNNKYGVPISLFNINKKNVFGIFEVGMDRKGEIDKLTKLIKPDLGIITNISYAHAKNFKNLSDIASAKSEIIDNINKGGTIILNKQDKFFNFFKKKSIKNNLKIISFAKNINADVMHIKTIRKKSDCILFIKSRNKLKKFVIKYNLLPYLDNILATVAVISIYFDIQKIKENIFYNFPIPGGRGNLINIKLKNKEINIIDESYNSNPLSLKFAIDKFNSLKINNKRKILLLGDMLELGKYAKKLHIEAAKYINKSNINKVFVTGKMIKETFNKIKTQKKGKILKNNIEILDLIKKDLNTRDFLMIKGSNATGLNTIVSKIKLGEHNAL